MTPSSAAGHGWMMRQRCSTLLTVALVGWCGWAGPVAAGVTGDLDSLVEALQAGKRSGYEAFSPLPAPADGRRSQVGREAVADSAGAATMQHDIADAEPRPVASASGTVHVRVLRDAEVSRSEAVALDLIRRGTEALHAGASERAVRLLREGVKLAPGHVPGHTNLGAALLHDGRPAEAVSSLETAVALAPHQAAGWNNLAVAEWRRGSIDAARTHFLRAAALDPSAASALVNLALLESRQGDRERAMLTLRHALTRPDVPPQAHLQLAFALERAGRPAEAASHLELYLATAQVPEPGLGSRLHEHLRMLRTTPSDPIVEGVHRSHGFASDD